jgi:hypothetical protein
MKIFATNFRSLAQCALPAAVLLVAPAALAQQAGTYTGTNSEGYGLEVVVAGSNGSFAITGVSDGANVYCKQTEIGGWGLGIGTNDPITGHKATLNINDTTVYYQGAFNFKGNTVIVKQLFEVPVLTGTKTPPKTACAASSGNITTTLTLSGTETRPPSSTVFNAAPFRPAR